MTVRTAHTVRPSKVLAVIDSEVKMMQCVVRGTIYNLLERVSGNHVRVMNENGPEVDANEECEVQMPLHREEEDEQVVRYGLREAVDGVERVGGEGRRN